MESMPRPFSVPEGPFAEGDVVGIALSGHAYYRIELPHRAARSYRSREIAVGLDEHNHVRPGRRDDRQDRFHGVVGGPRVEREDPDAGTIFSTGPGGARLKKRTRRDQRGSGEQHAGGPVAAEEEDRPEHGTCKRELTGHIGTEIRHEGSLTEARREGCRGEHTKIDVTGESEPQARRSRPNFSQTLSRIVEHGHSFGSHYRAVACTSAARPIGIFCRSIRIGTAGA
jgi:hypothetical protein